MKKNIIIGIIALVVIVLAIILLSSSNNNVSDSNDNASTTSTSTSQMADSPQAIMNDAKSLQVDDINNEFQDIDLQIKGL
jgi:peptidoglycan hydrolase CwlO-like protein